MKTFCSCKFFCQKKKKKRNLNMNSYKNDNNNNNKDDMANTPYITLSIYFISRIFMHVFTVLLEHWRSLQVIFSQVISQPLQKKNFSFEYGMLNVALFDLFTLLFYITCITKKYHDLRNNFSLPVNYR